MGICKAVRKHFGYRNDLTSKTIRSSSAEYKIYLLTGCSGKIGFFSQEFSLFCQLSLANTGLLLVVKIGQPIGMTVHSHLVESFGNLFQRYADEGWVAVDNETSQLFLNTLHVNYQAFGAHSDRRTSLPTDILERS